jgi:predicted RND superfamily exporter protein
MAIVILGGLITSTLLTLFVLPSLYLRFAKSRECLGAPASCLVAERGERPFAPPVEPRDRPRRKWERVERRCKATVARPHQAAVKAPALVEEDVLPRS